MEDVVKQRLVGGIILLCVAVIFLPMLFEQPVVAPLPPMSLPAVPKVAPPKIAAVKPTPIELQKNQQNDSSKFDNKSQTKAQAPAQAPIKSKSVVAQKVQTKKATTSVTKAASVKTKPQVTFDKRGVPNAWVVQVGSYGDLKNAIAMRNKLRKKGYNAFVESYLGDNRQKLNRVYVGPKLDLNAVKLMQAKLDATLKAKTVVAQYRSPKNNT